MYFCCFSFFFFFYIFFFFFFFFSSRRRHTRSLCDWSSDVCSSDLRKTHRLLSVLFRTFSHFFMLFIRKVEKAMSSTCQNAFRVAQKSRWPFKSKESIVAWKSTCILTKVKQNNIKYSTALVIVVAVRRRWWCPSLSVVSGGCPSPCVTVGAQ